MNTKQNERRYLCDFPEPDAAGRTHWLCAVCCVEAAQGGPPAQRGPVVMKQQKIPGGWVDVPVCAEHEAHHTDEQRREAVVLMFTERKFKEKGGGPLTEEDFEGLLIR